jgi:hypothetical protein
MTKLEITHVLLFLVLVFLLYLMSNCGCSGNGFNVGGQDDSCLDKIEGLEKVCCGIRPSDGEGGDVDNCKNGYPYVCEGDCPLAIESARETCANDKNIDEPDRKLVIDNLNYGCKGVPFSNPPWPFVPTDDEIRMWGVNGNVIDFTDYIGYEKFYINYGASDGPPVQDYSTKNFYKALPGGIVGKTITRANSTWTLFADLACFGVGDIQLKYDSGNYKIIIPIKLVEGNLPKITWRHGPIRNLTIDIILGVYETLDDLKNRHLCKTIKTSISYIQAIVVDTRELYIGKDLPGIKNTPVSIGSNICKYVTIKELSFHVHYFV